MARANLLALEVWHFTLRFVLHGVWLAIPVDLERRVVSYCTQSLPKVSRVRGGGEVYSESCTRHARGAIPNEVGPTRCREENNLIILKRCVQLAVAWR
jgi:hypothetical protein